MMHFFPFLMNERKIARERIKKLFDMAREEALKENWERSRRYVRLARKIAMKFNISISKYKRKFCKKCNTYFTSKTVRIRTQKKNMKVAYTCLVCGNIQRYPYVKEKLKRKA